MRVAIALEIGVQVGVRVEVQHRQAAVACSERAQHGIGDRMVTAEHQQRRALRQRVADAPLDDVERCSRAGLGGHRDIAMVDDGFTRPHPDPAFAPRVAGVGAERRADGGRCLGGSPPEGRIRVEWHADQPCGRGVPGAAAHPGALHRSPRPPRARTERRARPPERQLLAAAESAATSSNAKPWTHRAPSMAPERRSIKVAWSGIEVLDVNERGERAASTARNVRRSAFDRTRGEQRSLRIFDLFPTDGEAPRSGPRARLRRAQCILRCLLVLELHAEPAQRLAPRRLPLDVVRRDEPPDEAGVDHAAVTP